MSDPIKGRFKCFTFKLYDIDGRHDQRYFDTQYNLFASDPHITLIDSFYDYCSHVGIHRNGILRSNSYKSLYNKYTGKSTKVPGVYLFFGDLATCIEYNRWLFYCYFRQETNFRRFLPKEVRDRGIDQGSMPLSSPQRSPSCRSNNDYNPDLKIEF